MFYVIWASIGPTSHDSKVMTLRLLPGEKKFRSRVEAEKRLAELKADLPDWEFEIREEDD